MDYVSPTGLSPQQYLAKVKAAFEEDAKYRILGKPDAVFQAIARVVPEASYALTKARRVSMATNVKQKEASGAPADIKTASQAKLRFYSSIMPDLNAVKTTQSATKMARALSSITGEFKTAVQAFVTAAGTDPDLARDSSFEASAKLLHDKLTILVSSQKGRLRAENQFYNTNIVNASKDLAEIKAALNAFTPGAAASSFSSSVTVPAEEPSALDVTV